MTVHQDKPEWLVSSAEIDERETRLRTSREVIRLVYSMYRRTFLSYYKLSLPPSLFVLLVYFLRNVALSRLDVRLLGFQRWIAANIGVGLVSTMFAWLFEIVAFSAVSAAVIGGGEPASDGYARSRERMGALSYVAIMTFTRFVAIFGILIYFVPSAIDRVLHTDVRMNAWYWTAGTYLMYIVSAAAIMGYAFAVPIVVKTDRTGHQAMRESWQLTNGYEGAIFRLLGEALVAIFVANYAGRWFGWYLVRQFDFGVWAGWIEWIVTAVIGAAAAIPMFIGFTLLYQRASSQSRSDSFAR